MFKIGVVNVVVFFFFVGLMKINLNNGCLRLMNEWIMEYKGGKVMYFCFIFGCYG